MTNRLRIGSERFQTNSPSLSLETLTHLLLGLSINAPKTDTTESVLYFYQQLGNLSTENKNKIIQEQLLLQYENLFLILGYELPSDNELRIKYLEAASNIYNMYVKKIFLVNYSNTNGQYPVQPAKDFFNSVVEGQDLSTLLNYYINSEHLLIEEIIDSFISQKLLGSIYDESNQKHTRPELVDFRQMVNTYIPRTLNTHILEILLSKSFDDSILNIRGLLELNKLFIDLEIDNLDVHNDLLMLAVRYKLKIQGLRITLFSLLDNHTNETIVQVLKLIHDAYPCTDNEKTRVLANCCFLVLRSLDIDHSYILDVAQSIDHNIVDLVGQHEIFEISKHLSQKPDITEILEESIYGSNLEDMHGDLITLIDDLSRNPEKLSKGLEFIVGDVIVTIGSLSSSIFYPFKEKVLGFTPGIYNTLEYTDPEHSESIYIPGMLPNGNTLWIYVHDDNGTPLISMSLVELEVSYSLSEYNTLSYQHVLPTLQLMTPEMDKPTSITPHLSIPIGRVDTRIIFEASRLSSVIEVLKVKTKHIHNLINRGYSRDHLEFFMSILEGQSAVYPEIALENLKTLIENKIILPNEDNERIANIFGSDIHNLNNYGLKDLPGEEELKIAFRKKMDTAKAIFAYVLGLILLSQGKGIFGNSKFESAAADFGKEISGTPMQYIDCTYNRTTNDFNIFKPYLEKHNVVPFLYWKKFSDGCIRTAFRYFSKHPELSIIRDKELLVDPMFFNIPNTHAIEV